MGRRSVVDTSSLASREGIQNASYTYAADAGANDSYAITVSPAPSAYAEGQQFTFKANTANTGAATLDVNSLGAKTLKKNHDQDLATGDIESGSIVEVVYDGTNFQVTSITAASAGDASGPASSTDNAIARFDGAGGKTLQNSGVLVDDSDNITGAASLELSDDTGILDENGNKQVNFQTTASAVNYFEVQNSDAGNRITLRATGSDANVGLTLALRGTEDFRVASNNKSIDIDPSGSADGLVTTITPSTTSSNKTITLPDATDTLVGKATTDTLTNKTFDANGTGNSLSNVEVADLASSAKTGSDTKVVTGTAGTDGNTATWNADGDLVDGPPPTSSVQFVIDGGGSAITTGVKGYLEVPFACTIDQVTMLADQSGSIVVDIWKDTYANYPPTDADSITASAVPTISAATKSQDGTLTGWTTSVSAGDILGFNVDSASTVTRVTVALKVTRT